MNYDYIGRRPSGQRVKGKIDAESKRKALSELEEKGMVIFRLEETKPWNKDLILNHRVKNKAFIIFLRQYATLIRAGIPISEATKTMVRQTENHALRMAMEDIDRKLSEGSPLSEAASNHPRIFPELLVNMIHAGEVSGTLDKILNDMADYYEKQYRNRQKVVSALLYPSVVGVITVLLSIFLLVFVVPQFVGMFQSFGEEIPAYTAFILSLSDLAAAYWWTLPLTALILAITYTYLMRKDRFVCFMDRMKMKTPFLGMLVQKNALVKMTQTLSTLVNSAVPIIQAVEITEKVVGNKVIEEVLVKANHSLAAGDSLTVPMKDHWAVPDMVVQMIQIGEQTGTLDEMLQKAAVFYEEDVDQLSNRIKTMIEPLMIIILTVLVGGIVAAIILPMFGMFESL